MSIIVVYCLESSFKVSDSLKSSFKKSVPPSSAVQMSSMQGSGWLSGDRTQLTVTIIYVKIHIVVVFNNRDK